MQMILSANLNLEQVRRFHRVQFLCKVINHFVKLMQSLPVKLLAILETKNKTQQKIKTT